MTTPTETLSIVRKIAVRAVNLYDEHNIEIDRLQVTMAVLTCHERVCKLRLAALAEAPDFDFVHDIGGLLRHLDPIGYKLDDCFLPRFADLS